MLFNPGKSVLSLLLLFFVSAQAAFAFQDTEVNSVILDDSKLTINGTSNVNDFECVYQKEIEEDTLRHYVKFEEALAHVGGDNIYLVVDSFDCGKKGINRDFRNTLKSKVYPTIDVKLVTVKYNSDGNISAEVAIYIAGVTQQYEVQLEQITVEGEITQIIGNQKVRLSDFNIDPPKALFGLIKVNDEMNISFSLRIKQ